MDRAGRKALFILLAAVAFVACGKSGKQKFRPYGVQRAHLHFEFFGSSRGYEDLFIDSFGALETHFVHQDLVSKNEVKTIKLMIVKRGADLTIVDSQLLAESKTKDTRLDSLYQLSPGDAPSSEEEFASYFKEGRFHKIGDTTVLGLKANVWEQAEDPVYVIEWRGVMIGRKVSIIGPEMELRLASVDTTSPIDPKLFIAPTGLPPIPPRPAAASRRPAIGQQQ